MDTFKVNINSRVLEAAEWPSFIPPNNTTFPALFKIRDGSSKLYTSSTFYMWVPLADTNTLMSSSEILPAPNLGISESTLLKALAIAQNPDLAYALLRVER
jgi:hypothetical protein